MPSRDQMVVDLSTNYRNKQDFDFAKYKKKIKSHTTALLTQEYNLLILGIKKPVKEKPVVEQKGGQDGNVQDRPRARKSIRKRTEKNNS